MQAHAKDGFPNANTSQERSVQQLRTTLASNEQHHLDYVHPTT